MGDGFGSCVPWEIKSRPQSCPRAACPQLSLGNPSQGRHSGLWFKDQKCPGLALTVEDSERLTSREIQGSNIPSPIFLG